MRVLSPQVVCDRYRRRGFAFLHMILAPATLLFSASAALSVEIPFQFRVAGTMSAWEANDVHGEDLDGDGDRDLVAVSSQGNELTWFQNDGASPPLFTRHTIVVDALNGPYGPGQPLSVFAADLDGDQDQDILTAGSRIMWWQNQGGSTPAFLLASTMTIGTVAGGFSVFAADVDGDEDMDVLSASQNDDKIAWYENDGGSPPAFTPHTIVDLNSGVDRADGARSVLAADLDGDGDTDVLSASYLDDKVAWYENDGNTPPAFTPRAITTSLDWAMSVKAGDLDGDEDLDVISSSSTNHIVAWYENDGGAPPGFTPRVVSTDDLGPPGPLRVASADVDRDGHLDVISNAWFENLGGSPPVFTTRTVGGGFNGILYAGDLDGDLDPEFVTATSTPDWIVWYENLLPPPPIPALHRSGILVFLLLAGSAALLWRRRRRDNSPRR